MLKGTGNADPKTFWNRLLKTPRGCWEFQGFRLTQGYGSLGFGGRSYRAHRYAWTLAKGPIPDGLQVLHRCDNPPCANPDHLFLGTADDNIKDRVSKGRSKGPKGTRAPKAKLTGKQVVDIRSAYSTGMYTLEEIGSHYGVTKKAIHAIVRRESWAHIP